MTPQQQRIAIAEACGITITAIDRDANTGEIIRVWSKAPQGHHQNKTTPWLPDYLNDLNAMHGAERWIFTNHPDIWSDYVREVQRKTGSLSSIHATAAQRAEALLRTLNLWKVEENNSL
jgi:hypothetical protein